MLYIYSLVGRHFRLTGAYFVVYMAGGVTFLAADEAQKLRVTSNF